MNFLVRFGLIYWKCINDILQGADTVSIGGRGGEGGGCSNSARQRVWGLLPQNTQEGTPTPSHPTLRATVVDGRLRVLTRE